MRCRGINQVIHSKGMKLYSNATRCSKFVSHNEVISGKLCQCRNICVNFILDTWNREREKKYNSPSVDQAFKNPGKIQESIDYQISRISTIREYDHETL